MKPGDHPEFFRLPPPPGASRDSTIRLDRDGRFFHDGGLVDKRALSEALHRWVDRHPDDGRYILTNGYDWTYFEVEDTPCFVVGVKGRPPAPPVLVLAGGNEEPLDPSTLVADADGACFVTVRGGKFEARLLRQAQNELEPWLLADAPPRLAIEGREQTIGRRAAQR
jgi:hypothetical protein